MDLQFSKYFHFLPSQSYLEVLYLQKHALGIIADSGGLQEESTYLHKPCLTLRDNAERSITIAEGTNTLIASDSSLFQTTLTENQKSRLVKKYFWNDKKPRFLARVKTFIYSKFK
jgi:UDP-N-acetylglucosamine 2-epimerase